MADLEGLKRAVEVSPDNAPLIVMLAQAYLESFSPDEAREHFERALALEPDNSDAKLGLIETFEQNWSTLRGDRASRSALRLGATECAG